MKRRKKAFVIIIACVAIIFATAITWRMAKPAEAKMKPCDAEFTIYTPTHDGDNMMGLPIEIIHDNKYNHEYILINGKCITPRYQ